MSVSDQNGDQHALTGLYVADALPADERRFFESHLSRCADCQQEVAELRETVALLGAAEYVNPPPSLRTKVLAEASRTRQLPPVVTRLSRRQDAAKVRRSPWPIAVAAALVLVLGGITGGLAWQNRSLQSDLTAAQEAGSSVREVLTAPDARTITAEGADGGRGAVVTSASLDRTVFVADQLPDVSSDRTYQLWYVTPDGATSADVVGTDVSGDFTRSLPPAPEGATAVAVSVEPAGGSQAPTTTPIMALPTA